MVYWVVFVRSFDCSACRTRIACNHARYVFVCTFPGHMWLWLICFSFLWTLLSSSAFIYIYIYIYLFIFVDATERAVGCHSSPGSDWPQPTVRMPVLQAGLCNITQGSLWAELQLWADAPHIVKQPPPLLSACYTTVCLLFASKGSSGEEQSRKYILKYGLLVDWF